MRQNNFFLPKLATTFVAIMVSACSPSGGGSAAKPAGETDLSCAALLYAANSLIDKGTATDPDGIIKDKYFWAMTSYATAHATAEKLGSSEALGVVKLKALRMMGTVPSPSDKISSTKIVDRAKACVAS